MKRIEIQIIQKLDSDFIKKWSALVNSSVNAHFFNTPQWFISCIDTYDIKEYFVFAAYYENELVGILPLVKEKKFGIEVFASPGKRYLEKSTILVKDDNYQILTKLINEVCKYGNIYLTELSEEIAEMLSKNQGKGLLTLSSINPYIRLKDNPFGSISKKQKNRITGKIRKNLGNIKFVHLRNNLGFHLQTVFDLETRSSKKLANKGSFSDAKIRKLFTSLINYAKGYISIDFILYNNQPIVSSLGFVFKDRYLAYYTCYDNNFRDYFPGKILTYFMLSKLREERVEVFDFSRGHNSFKNDFTKNWEFQYDFYFSKNPLIRIWWEGINNLRRLKQILIRDDSSLDADFLFNKYKSNYSNEPNVRLVLK